MRTFFVVLVIVSCSLVSVALGGATDDLRPLSQAQINAILDGHNTPRVTLGAKDMVNLTWDPALADIWVEANPNYCTFNHFSGRSAAYGAAVGENLYATSSSTLNYFNWIQSWVNERVYYTIGKYPNTCVSGQVCGHWTQVAWTNSVKVGCANFDCSGSGGWRNLFVCNYYPAGNYMNQYAWVIAEEPCVPTNPCTGVPCGTKVNNCQQTVTCPNTCTTTQTCSSNTCNACPSQCGDNTCGSVYNSCYNNGNGGTEVCGSNNGDCEAGLDCIDNICTNSTPSCTPKTSDELCPGVCGTFSNGCGGNVHCGCDADEQCDSGICEVIPCGGTCKSELFEECTSDNECVCVSGYTRDSATEECVADSPPSTNPPPPDTNPPPPASNNTKLTSWEPFKPVPSDSGSSDWVLLPDGSQVEMVGTGATDYRIRWVTAAAYVSEEQTSFKADVLLTGNGEFGLALREQSNVYSLFKLAVSNTVVTVNWEVNSANIFAVSKSPKYSGWKANDWNTVELVMSDQPQYDAMYGQDIVWFTLKVNGQVATSSYYHGMSASVFPQTGGVFLYAAQYASFKNTYIYTSTSLLVTFAGCLTQDQLDSLCATFQASDCRIESPCSDSKKRQGELSSTAVITFTSTDSVTSNALASQFSQAASVKDPRLSDVSISNVQDGKGFAGDANADESQASVQEFNSENTAGGGGGSGLSTGAIIGIAVGGAAALLIAAAVVAAVAVAAVLVARKVKHSKSQEKIEMEVKGDPRKPKSGADVFDYEDDGNGHKSITARVPEGYADSISHI